MPYDNTPAPSAPDAAGSFRGWGTGSADLGRQLDFTGQVSDFFSAGATGQSQTGMPTWRPMGSPLTGDGGGGQTPTLHPFTLDRVQSFLSGGQRIPTWTGAPTWNWSGLPSPGATGTQSLLNLTGARLSAHGSGARTGDYDLSPAGAYRLAAQSANWSDRLDALGASLSDLTGGQLLPGDIPQYTPVEKPSAAERAQARLAYARSHLGSKEWARTFYDDNTSHWKCNEFVAAVHRKGDPCGNNYPNAHHGLTGDVLDFVNPFGIGDLIFSSRTMPTVADLANPEFAKDKLDYLDIKDAQPGDIIVWHDASNGTHHCAICSGDGNIISAGEKFVSEKPYAELFKGVNPIIRRYK